MQFDHRDKKSKKFLNIFPIGPPTGPRLVVKKDFIWQLRIFMPGNMTKISDNNPFFKPGHRFAELLLPVNYYIPD